MRLHLLFALILSPLGLAAASVLKAPAPREQLLSVQTAHPATPTSTAAFLSNVPPTTASSSTGKIYVIGNAAEESGDKRPKGNMKRQYYLQPHESDADKKRNVMTWAILGTVTGVIVCLLILGCVVKHRLGTRGEQGQGGNEYEMERLERRHTR